MSDCVINRMTSSDIPHIMIKNSFQKRDDKYSDILTHEILKEICFKANECSEFEIEWDGESYNKGRLVKIEYKGEVIYISLSEDGKIEGRNSSMQSFPSALLQFHEDENPKKRICYYFLKHEGNAATPYHIFTYRIMKTIGIEFLNSVQEIAEERTSKNGNPLKENKRSVIIETADDEIDPIDSINDMILNKDSIRGDKDASNNSTYITTNQNGDVEISVKVYGASKYESVLLADAASKILAKRSFLQKLFKKKKIILYEIVEKDLKKLPSGNRKYLESIKNIEIISTDRTLDKKEYKAVYPDCMRNYRFNHALGVKFGTKKCEFCFVTDARQIQDAHIWGVAELRKRQDLTKDEKCEVANDEMNGIRLCSRHHRWFDNKDIKLTNTGEIKIKKHKVKIITIKNTYSKINTKILTTEFLKNLHERNKLLPPNKDYVEL